MKLTKNAEKILELFKQGHLFTGVELVKRLPEMDKATIYRNLEKLVSNGVLKEVNIKKGVTSYELNHEHFHLICNNCGNIDEFDIDRAKLEELLEKSEMAIESIELNVKGFCVNCQKD